MIGLGAKYLKGAGFGRYRITAASLGSNLMFGSLWLKDATRQAIMAAFGADGTAVIRATNEYLNGIAAQGQAGKDKATALAGFINEDPMMVCSLGLEPQGVTMPKRWIIGDGQSYIKTGVLSDIHSGIKGDAIYADVSNTQPGYCYVFASGVTQTFGVTFWNQKWGTGYGSSDSNGPTLHTDAEYQIENMQGAVKITGTDGTNYTKTYTGTPIIVSAEMYFPASHQVNVIPSKNPKLKNTHFEIYNDSTAVRRFVPYIVGTNGLTADKVAYGGAQVAGTKGYLDIVNCIFYPNAGTGQFTIPDISYTPTP